MNWITANHFVFWILMESRQEILTNLTLWSLICEIIVRYFVFCWTFRQKLKKKCVFVRLGLGLFFYCTYSMIGEYGAQGGKKNTSILYRGLNWGVVDESYNVKKSTPIALWAALTCSAVKLRATQVFQQNLIILIISRPWKFVYQIRCSRLYRVNFGRSASP